MSQIDDIAACLKADSLKERSLWKDYQGAELDVRLAQRTGNGVDEAEEEFNKARSEWHRWHTTAQTQARELCVAIGIDPFALKMLL